MVVFILKDVWLYDLLLNVDEFNEIAKNMLYDEFYFMQDKVYDLFVEIECGGKIVGFLVANFFDEDILIIELAYILPEYRDKGLFTGTILDLEEDYELYLDLPNRFLINSLLENGKAELVGEGLVKSSYLLSFRNPFNNDERLCSYYYDLRISGVVCDNVVSPLLNVDIECFNADVERERYMDKIVDEGGDVIWCWS